MEGQGRGPLCAVFCIGVPRAAEQPDMIQTSRSSSGRARWPWLAAVAAIGLTASLGCRSTSKADVRLALLQLEKNQAASELGLSRREIEVQVAGETQRLELVYLHAPAQRPSTTRRPVVLVHGTPSTLFNWTEVALGGPDFDGLSADRDVYAIEVIGHGIAPGDFSPYSFQKCADFVVSAVRGLELEDVHLVGHSYGGEFAWRAALDAPELFRSLTLSDSSGYARTENVFLPEEVEMRENRLAKIGWIINSRDRIRTALTPHFDGIPPNRVDEFFLVADNSHNWKAMVDLVRDENGGREQELPDLSTPTLLAWGQNDIAYPVDVVARRFERDLGNAHLVVIPGTGHYPHEEQPAEVVSALQSFFASQELEGAAR